VKLVAKASIFNGWSGFFNDFLTAKLYKQLIGELCLPRCMPGEVAGFLKKVKHVIGIG
jgi:hypothetical protein